MLATFVEVVTAGLIAFFNRVVVAGLLGKAIFLVIFTWLTTVILSGLVSWLAGKLQVTSFGSLFGPLGDVGAVGLYLFSFTLAPYLAAYIPGILIRFIIRRLPIIG